MFEDSTTKGSPALSPAVPETACLILIYGGPDLGRRFELNSEVTVGRDPSSEIWIDLSHVSRQHARFTRKGAEWCVSDLGSTNGTQVNGMTVTGEAILRSGDQIKVGSTIFKYVSGGNIESLFHEEIYRMTIYDGLTKIHNKRYFLDFLEREIARSRRYGSPLALILFDIDHFKALNDEHGHPAGDHVLERVAAAVSNLVRREQLFARYGGEEFAVVLPEINLEQLRTYGENVRSTVQRERIEFAGATLKVTVSAGAAVLAPSMGRDELISVADEQLYRSKRGGRNRVSLALTSAGKVTPEIPVDHE